MQKSKQLWFNGLVLALTLASAAQAQNWTETRLNDSAVTNETGEMIVLGTEGSYSTAIPCAKEAVFDGDTATFFDPLGINAQNAWAGFELQSPKIVTRIRYVGRDGWAARMVGVLFQGANQADFSDAVTIHTHTPPANWNPTNWISTAVSSTNMLRTFRYLRYISPAPSSYGGNMGELEFYGVEPAAAPPPAPTISTAITVNWTANIRWTAAADGILHEIQRRLPGQPAFETIHTVTLQTGTSLWRASEKLPCSAEYRLRALNNQGASEWVETGLLTSENALTGTWIGSPGSYNSSGSVGNRAYDGNIDTYYDAAAGSGHWTGLDFGQSQTITAIRYMPRPTFAGRLVNGQFQIADNPAFDNPVTLHTISATPAYNTMTSYTLPVPASARYARYISPSGGSCNVNEVEFINLEGALPAPHSLAALSSDFTNRFPVLSWDYRLNHVVTSGIVERATSPGGPYAAIASVHVSEPIQWIDTTAAVGVPYYYRVKAVYIDGQGATHQSPPSDPVHYRRIGWLERTWADVTQLRSGAELIGGHYTPYNQSGLVAYMFDGDMGTRPDTNEKNPAIGVKFTDGAQHVLAFRFAPRTDQDWIGRLTGAELRGSNSDDLTPYTVLATFPAGTKNVMLEVPTTNHEPFTHIYIQRADGNQFNGNIAELELYGYNADMLAGIFTAPSGLTAVRQPDGIMLAWTPGTNGDTLQIERAAAAAPDVWTTLPAAVTGSTFTDTTASPNTRYLYRLKATAGAEEAWSETVTALYYTPGAGTGLHAEYRQNYTRAYDPAEAPFTTQTETIDFAVANGIPILPGFPGASVANVGIVWSGKLIVPFTGLYTIHMTSDDGCAVHIDGQTIINYWISQNTEHTQQIELSAGQHDLRVDYFQGSGAAAAKLEWSGPVDRELIPASQLIPLPPAADPQPAPWAGRSFNTSRLGRHEYNPATDAITIACSGGNFYNTSEGHHFVHREVSGDFAFESAVAYTGPASDDIKLMLMARDALPVGSPVVTVTLGANKALSARIRPTASAGLTYNTAPTAIPGIQRLRLTRQKNVFTFSAYGDEGTWVDFHTYTDAENAFGKTLHVGMAMILVPTSDDAHLTKAAVFTAPRLSPLGRGTVLQLR